MTVELNYLLFLYFAASVFTLIIPPSSVVGGFLMDTFGRLYLRKLSAIPTILGWILIAVSRNVTMISLGRLLLGVGASELSLN